VATVSKIDRSKILFGMTCFQLFNDQLMSFGVRASECAALNLYRGQLRIPERRRIMPDAHDFQPIFCKTWFLLCPAARAIDPIEVRYYQNGYNYET
jgi:hypothetical protein